MFKSIKLRIIKGRQLLPFATAKVLQDHEDRLKALEEGDSSDNEQTSDNTEQPSSNTSPVTRDLSFTVNDGLNPIEGATVTIGSKSSTTGAAGGCTIKGVEEGSVQVEVSCEGFVTNTETITVDESHTSFTISLENAGG